MSAQNYRQRCFERWDEKCACCGDTTAIEVHHIDGNASNNEKANLIPLCTGCHNIVESHSWTAELNSDIDTNNPLLTWLIKVKRTNSPNTEPSQREERKNLKIDSEMYDRLREEKTQYETWNHLFDRLLREADTEGLADE